MSGSVRTLTPATASSAFATAGATGGTASSLTPPQEHVFGLV